MATEPSMAPLVPLEIQGQGQGPRLRLVNVPTERLKGCRQSTGVAAHCVNIKDLAGCSKGKNVATLTIVRGSAYVDYLRSYKILVDGSEVGRIKNGGTWSGEVSPGSHIARCTIDWARTELFPFEVHDGDEVRLRVAINYDNPFDFLLGRHLYLEYV